MKVMVRFMRKLFLARRIDGTTVLFLGSVLATVSLMKDAPARLNQGVLLFMDCSIRITTMGINKDKLLIRCEGSN